MTLRSVLALTSSMTSLVMLTALSAGCSDDAADAGGGGRGGSASSSNASTNAATSATATTSATTTTTSNASATSTSSASASAASGGTGSGTMIACTSFDDGALPPSWSIGAQGGGTVAVSTDTAQTYQGSAGSLRGTYPVASGGVYVWSSYDLAALGLSDLYVSFAARMPEAKQGLKFLKVFGKDMNGGYANTTFGLDYTGGDAGAMYQVSFGDGSSTGNDTAQVINFDGTYPEWIGRSFGTATVSTPQAHAWSSSNWGSDWHRFRMHLKFNTGTSAADEVADGAYYVEVDGNVYVDASGLFNRHPANGPIDRVELFGWAQNGDAPFELWYDDVCLSTGGFL